ncbi:unnamed protein product [Amoebophrya sp. A25]|nr:unnamed protein product [Amoebophrya sp. A25]|eukprot:GSA25T00010135001.1
MPSQSDEPAVARKSSLRSRVSVQAAANVAKAKQQEEESQKGKEKPKEEKCDLFSDPDDGGGNDDAAQPKTSKSSSGTSASSVIGTLGRVRKKPRKDALSDDDDKENLDDEEESRFKPKRLKKGGASSSSSAVKRKSDGGQLDDFFAAPEDDNAFADSYHFGLSLDNNILKNGNKQDAEDSGEEEGEEDSDDEEYEPDSDEVDEGFFSKMSGRSKKRGKKAQPTKAMKKAKAAPKKKGAKKKKKRDSFVVDGLSDEQQSDSDANIRSDSDDEYRKAKTKEDKEWMAKRRHLVRQKKKEAEDIEQLWGYTKSYLGVTLYQTAYGEPEDSEEEEREEPMTVHEIVNLLKTKLKTFPTKKYLDPTQRPDLDDDAEQEGGASSEDEEDSDEDSSPKKKKKKKSRALKRTDPADHVDLWYREADEDVNEVQYPAAFKQIPDDSRDAHVIYLRRVVGHNEDGSERKEQANMTEAQVRELRKLLIQEIPGVRKDHTAPCSIMETKRVMGKKTFKAKTDFRPIVKLIVDRKVQNKFENVFYSGEHKALGHRIYVAVPPTGGVRDLPDECFLDPGRKYPVFIVAANQKDKDTMPLEKNNVPGDDEKTSTSGSSSTSTVLRGKISIPLLLAAHKSLITNAERTFKGKWKLLLQKPVVMGDLDLPNESGVAPAATIDQEMRQRLEGDDNMTSSKLAGGDAAASAPPDASKDVKKEGANPNGTQTQSSFAFPGYRHENMDELPPEGLRHYSQITNDFDVVWLQRAALLLNHAMKQNLVTADNISRGTLTDAQVKQAKEFHRKGLTWYDGKNAEKFKMAIQPTLSGGIGGSSHILSHVQTMQSEIERQCEDAEAKHAMNLEAKRMQLEAGGGFGKRKRPLAAATSTYSLFGAPTQSGLTNLQSTTSLGAAQPAGNQGNTNTVVTGKSFDSLLGPATDAAALQLKQADVEEEMLFGSLGTERLVEGGSSSSTMLKPVTEHQRGSSAGGVEASGASSTAPVPPAQGGKKLTKLELLKLKREERLAAQRAKTGGNAGAGAAILGNKTASKDAGNAEPDDDRSRRSAKAPTTSFISSAHADLFKPTLSADHLADVKLAGSDELCIIDESQTSAGGEDGNNSYAYLQEGAKRQKQLESKVRILEQNIQNLMTLDARGDQWKGAVGEVQNAIITVPPDRRGQLDDMLKRVLERKKKYPKPSKDLISMRAKAVGFGKTLRKSDSNPDAMDDRSRGPPKSKPAKERGGGVKEVKETLLPPDDRKTKTRPGPGAKKPLSRHDSASVFEENSQMKLVTNKEPTPTSSNMIGGGPGSLFFPKRDGASADKSTTDKVKKVPSIDGGGVDLKKSRSRSGSDDKVPGSSPVLGTTDINKGDTSKAPADADVASSNIKDTGPNALPANLDSIQLPPEVRSDYECTPTGAPPAAHMDECLQSADMDVANSLSQYMGQGGHLENDVKNCTYSGAEMHGQMDINSLSLNEVGGNIITNNNSNSKNHVQHAGRRGSCRLDDSLEHDEDGRDSTASSQLLLNRERSASSSLQHLNSFCSIDQEGAEMQAEKNRGAQGANNSLLNLCGGGGGGAKMESPVEHVVNPALSAGFGGRLLAATKPQEYGDQEQQRKFLAEMNMLTLEDEEESEIISKELDHDDSAKLGDSLNSEDAVGKASSSSSSSAGPGAPSRLKNLAAREAEELERQRQERVERKVAKQLLKKKRAERLAKFVEIEADESDASESEGGGEVKSDMDDDDEENAKRKKKKTKKKAKAKEKDEDADDEEGSDVDDELASLLADDEEESDEEDDVEFRRKMFLINIEAEKNTESWLDKYVVDRKERKRQRQIERERMGETARWEEDLRQREKEERRQRKLLDEEMQEDEILSDDVKANEAEREKARERKRKAAERDAKLLEIQAKNAAEREKKEKERIAKLLAEDVSGDRDKIMERLCKDQYEAAGLEWNYLEKVKTSAARINFEKAKEKKKAVRLKNRKRAAGIEVSSDDSEEDRKTFGTNRQLGLLGRIKMRGPIDMQGAEKGGR